MSIGTATRLSIFEQLRDELGAYNFTWLSEESGVSDATLYNWFNGVVESPHLRTVLAVAGAMGYDIQLVRTRGRLRAVA